MAGHLTRPTSVAPSSTGRFIEGTDGVVVYDTSDDLSRTASRRTALRTVTDKSRSRPSSTTTTTTPTARWPSRPARTASVISHPRVNANLAHGAAPSTFPRRRRRSRSFRRQFAAYLPGGPRRAAGCHVRGVHAPGNSFAGEPGRHRRRGADDHRRADAVLHRTGPTRTTRSPMWLPDAEVALNNFLAEPAQLHAARHRLQDPRSWRDGILLIRDLRRAPARNAHPAHQGARRVSRPSRIRRPRSPTSTTSPARHPA
ncbi:hypothetical protein HBB16_07465 [Pseudonocardia sp. MCCB 268]|nr:hypothetical protein [Pseudonocardia cytotoxica]